MGQANWLRVRLKFQNSSLNLQKYEKIVPNLQKHFKKNEKTNIFKIFLIYFSHFVVLCSIKTLLFPIFLSYYHMNKFLSTFYHFLSSTCSLLVNNYQISEFSTIPFDWDFIVSWISNQFKIIYKDFYT